MKGLVLLLITLGLAKSLSLDTEDTEVEPNLLSLDTEDNEVELDEENGGIPSGTYFIENVYTKRYLFQTGLRIQGERGSEGGWLASPAVVGADANYYNRAYWKIIPKGNGSFFIENVQSERYLFQTGLRIQGERGAEGGWLASSGFEAPAVIGADANYYNRAYWRFVPRGNGSFFIENVQSERYLFQDGPHIKGERGAEGGWLASPAVVGADANYHNRAYWILHKLQ